MEVYTRIRGVSYDRDKLESARDYLVREVFGFQYPQVEVIRSTSDNPWYGFGLDSEGLMPPPKYNVYRKSSDIEWGKHMKACASILGETGTITANFTYDEPGTGHDGYIYTHPRGIGYVGSEETLYKFLNEKFKDGGPICDAYKRVGRTILMKDNPEPAWVRAGRALHNNGLKIEGLGLRLDRLTRDSNVRNPKELEDTYKDLLTFMEIEDLKTTTEMQELIRKFELFETEEEKRFHLQTQRLTDQINAIRENPRSNADAIQQIEAGKDIIIQDRLFSGTVFKVKSEEVQQYISLMQESIPGWFLQRQDILMFPYLITSAGGLPINWPSDCVDYSLTLNDERTLALDSQDDLTRHITALTLIAALSKASYAPISNRPEIDTLDERRLDFAEMQERYKESKKRQRADRKKEKSDGFIAVIEELKEIASKEGPWESMWHLSESKVFKDSLVRNKVCETRRWITTWEKWKAFKIEARRQLDMPPEDYLLELGIVQSKSFYAPEPRFSFEEDDDGSDNIFSGFSLDYDDISDIDLSELPLDDDVL